MGFDHRERCFTPRSTEVPRAIRSKNRTGPLEAKTVRSSKTVCPQTGAPKAHQNRWFKRGPTQQQTLVSQGRCLEVSWFVW